MSKRPKRWSKRRLAAVAAGFAAGAVVLFWLSGVTERAAAAHGSNPTAAAVLSVPSFLLAMAIGLALLSGFSFGWLAWRIREDRIPPWERRDRKRRW